MKYSCVLIPLSLSKSTSGKKLTSFFLQLTVRVEKGTNLSFFPSKFLGFLLIWNFSVVALWITNSMCSRWFLWANFLYAKTQFTADFENLSMNGLKLINIQHGNSHSASIVTFSCSDEWNLSLEASLCKCEIASTEAETEPTARLGIGP